MPPPPPAGPPRGRRGRPALAAAAALLLAAGAAAADPAPRRCVEVVGTNDLHGAIEPYLLTSDAASVRLGGVIGLSGYVDALRRQHGERLVLVDGGDLFQGTMASNLSWGRAVIDAYNVLGYAAAAVGNHEFDFGSGGDGGDDRLAVLKARIAEAHFPFLTLNIFERGPGGRGPRVGWANTCPSFIRSFGGVRVGVLGISTPETPTVTRPDNVASLHFAAPLALVREEAQRLRDAGAELVVLVGHMGGRCRDTADPNDAASCQGSGIEAELPRLLQALPRGLVDVAVGGHTHQFMAHWVNGTATIESGARGQYLGAVTACVRPGGGLDAAASTIHPPTRLCLSTWADGGCERRLHGGAPSRPAQLGGSPVQPQAALVDAMAPYLDAVSGRAGQPLGVALPRGLGLRPLAQLLACALQEAGGTDFGLQNRGGVRQALPAGAITYGQVFAAVPFDNRVVRLRLRGAQVAQLVALLGRHQRADGGPALAGLTARHDAAGMSLWLPDGSPLDATRVYTLSTTDFIVEGGDGAGPLTRGLPAEAVVDTGVLMRDALVALLQRRHPG